MPTALSRELAAEALLSAIYTTDADACAKYGVSVRSLQRWRRQLANGDLELAGCVAIKKAAFDTVWAERLSPALTRGLQALDKSFSEIVELEFTNLIVGARLGRQSMNLVHNISGFSD